MNMHSKNVPKGPSEEETRVLSSIDETEIVELTKILIGFKSVNPPGNEKEIAKFIHDWFLQSEFKTEVREVAPNRPNVLAYLGKCKTTQTLIFNGHTDVVPTNDGWESKPFEANIEDGKITGRGAADMKGGLASMMVAMKSIKKSGVDLEGNLIFQGVVDEEVSSQGTINIVRDGLKANCAIIGEPTQLSICISHKGLLVFEVTAHGKSAHAAVRGEKANAIEAAVDLVNELRKQRIKIEKRTDPMLGCPSQTITKIDGGIAFNIVPENCTFLVDRRLVPGETVADVEDEFSSMLEDVHIRNPRLDFTLKTWPRKIGPMRISPEEEIVKTLESSAHDIGCQAKICGFDATADAYFLEHLAGVPTVLFGPGSLDQAHKENEHVEISQLVKAAKIYALTALRLLR